MMLIEPLPHKNENMARQVFFQETQRIWSSRCIGAEAGCEPAWAKEVKSSCKPTPPPQMVNITHFLFQKLCQWKLLIDAQCGGFSWHGTQHGTCGWVKRCSSIRWDCSQEVMHACILCIATWAQGRRHGITRLKSHSLLPRPPTDVLIRKLFSQWINLCPFIPLISCWVIPECWGVNYYSAQWGGRGSRACWKQDKRAFVIGMAMWMQISASTSALSDNIALYPTYVR